MRQEKNQYHKLLRNSPTPIPARLRRAFMNYYYRQVLPLHSRSVNWREAIANSQGTGIKISALVGHSVSQPKDTDEITAK